MHVIFLSGGTVCYIWRVKICCEWYEIIDGSISSSWVYRDLEKTHLTS